MYEQTPAGITEIKRATVDLWPDMARILGVSRNAIYEAARRGDFRTIRVGKRILVPIPEIRRLVDGESGESIHSEREVNLGTDKVQPSPQKAALQ